RREAEVIGRALGLAEKWLAEKRRTPPRRERPSQPALAAGRGVLAGRVRLKPAVRNPGSKCAAGGRPPGRARRRTSRTRAYRSSAPAGRRTGNPDTGRPLSSLACAARSPDRIASRADRSAHLPISPR